MSTHTNAVRFKRLMLVLAGFVFVLAGLLILPEASASFRSVTGSADNVDVGPQATSPLPTSARAGRPLSVIAVNGEAFLLDESSASIRKIRVKTSMPVFKAFGFSSDRRKLLYTPLRRGVPSGELVLEDLSTGKSHKIVSKTLIIAAAISPTADDQIAYTFASEGSFGLAVVDLVSNERRTLAAENVYAEQIQWDESGTGVHFFDTAAQPIDLASQTLAKDAFAEYTLWNDREHGTASQDQKLTVSERFVSMDPSLAGRSIEKTPAGFPKLRVNSTPNFGGSKKGARQGTETGHGFRSAAPDAKHEIIGGDLLSPSPLVARNLETGATKSLGEGMLLQTLETGAVIREISPTGTTQKFVDWEGKTTVLGVMIVNFMVPVENSTMVQGGANYPLPGSCGLAAHFGALGYAYDFQSTIVGTHAMASADGLVVFSSSSMNCNLIDTDCSDYSPTNCGGAYLGNVLVIQHSDGTYTSFAHLEFNSMQVAVGTSVCQGLYVARQGHTGSTAGDFNGCGDHVHFQRQVSPDYLGQSIAVELSDVPSNPLSCGVPYVSGATEISHTISPSTQAFGITGGSNSVSMTSTGCGWTAVSNDSWITVTSPVGGSGSGNGTVDYTVADNSTSGPRTGTMTIGGHTFTVTQAGGGVTNLAPVVNAGTDQTIVLPNSASLHGTATDDGLPAPPASTTVTWSKIAGPGTVGFSDPNALNSVATFGLAGVYTLRLSAFDGTLTSIDDLTVVVNVSGAGGQLTGGQAIPSPTVNLTGEGTSDWSHWGTTTSDSWDHKSGITPQIGNFTRIGPVGTIRYEGSPVSYNWNNGTPIPLTTTSTGVFTYGIGNGFQLTVPADTTEKRLKVYVGVWRAGGRFEATLSDGSASPYIDTTISSTNAIDGVYTIDFRAATDGQTLTVKWTLQSNTYPVANVTLQSASLSNIGPPANQAPVPNAGSDQLVTLPAVANLSGTASDDGLPAPPTAPSTTWSKFSGPGTVTFGNANLLNTTATFGAAGTYVLRLTASDGLLSGTDDVTVTVNAGGATGIVSATSGNTPTNVNLTAEGTADWAHWGLDSAGAFNRKNAAPQQISNFTQIGTGTILRYTNNPNGYTWTDGAPSGTATNTPNAVYVIGANNGFQITVPSDTNQRTLKMYVGLWSAGGTMEVTSSDGSSTTFVDTSLSNPGATSNRVYTVTYQGTSSGQTLTVKWTANTVFNVNGNVTLQAASLVQAPPSGSNSISGKVLFGVPNPGTKPVPNVSLTAAGSPQVQTTTDSSGNYSLNGLSAGSYTVTPTKLGDVNGITSFDAALTGRHAVGIITLNPNQRMAADASNDGLVTSFDAALIGRTAVGIPNPGIAGQWKFVASSTNYNLSGDVSGQDYNGFLIGDVSGDWIPPAGFGELPPVNSRQESENLGKTVKAEAPLNSYPKVFAGGGIPVSLPSDAMGSNNTVVEVPITVGDTTGQGIISVDTTITFSNLVLQRASPAFSTTDTLAGAAGCSVLVNPGTGSPLQIGISCFTNDLTGSGTLLKLRFLVTGTHPASTPLTFQSFVFNGGSPASATTDGVFTVQGPTAAAVSVGGRVVNANGYGIGRTRVTLSNAAGLSRVVMTNNFGYYRFTGVDSGEVYTISVEAKRHVFDDPTRVLVVLDDVTDADFVANN